MIVLKFGGKSLSDHKKITKIAKYIKQRSKQEKIIVVVSAMADLTDRLIATAEEYGKRPNLRDLDSLLSCGEAISASFMSIKLNALGVKSCNMTGWQAKILAEGEHGHGIIYGIEKSAIESKLKSCDCVVVAGFQAINSDGDIITLGRGGSDTTAVALGAAFDVPVEIFSDFDGICAGDPRERNYKKYKKVDYESAVKYAETGAKVLNKTSTEIALKSEVDVVCKCSASPHLTGTKLTKIPTPFVGINVKKGLCEIDLIFTNCNEKMQKTIKYILKNIQFHNIYINKEKVSLIIDEKLLDTTTSQLSKLNALE